MAKDLPLIHSVWEIEIYDRLQGRGKNGGGRQIADTGSKDLELSLRIHLIILFLVSVLLLLLCSYCCSFEGNVFATHLSQSPNAHLPALAGRPPLLYCWLAVQDRSG